jgi:dTDP-4-dehydrorhamnose reductase
MRIFITGANGQLAKTIAQLYPQKNLYLGTKEELNILDKNQVLRQIQRFKPHVIFHFASMTRGDECARYPEKAFDINVNGTRNIVSACANTNALLVFVSTNEVFDGKKQRPYVEGDKPSPITVVGRTKYEAEKIIQKTIEKHFIIRTSWLYSKWNSNFIHAVLKKVRKDKEIELVKDEISTPTYSVDLSIGIKKLIKTKKYGIYHLSNIGYASRMEFAKKAELKLIRNP